MLRIANRVLIGLVGLALLVLGGSVLIAGLGGPLPEWWFYDARSDVLLAESARDRYREDTWWWPAVFGALGLLFGLMVWSLIAQARRNRLTEVLVDSGDGQGALLRARALAGVLAGAAEDLHGVERADVLLVGRRSAPEARVQLVLEAQAAPRETLQRMTYEALATARDSAGLDRLPAEVRMGTLKRRAQRVS
ncbi:alkaline shock response membrane anchor protein AmaP [Streptomyces sp. TRM66268-LWL]|uniref:Alkaline shock response membrane anchor protein AmaP n=1 Tax=Streptomyces polyasparticus TaxID=2767826 RepID=A0ABR7SA09_9ACTN|nr:alkaline shock response membrane anchor protein AmaP [Streptomyces polyasparticus]MBC9711839.1 alkaline shock response membrane anchor protein AmaP [Streptomyces polyasparticus]